MTDRDRTGIPADLVGEIRWGDRSANTFATLSGGNGSFSVHGWHSYKAAGVYRVTITITDVESGKSATLSEKIKIR
jgi:hypothetical protein